MTLELTLRLSLIDLVVLHLDFWSSLGLHYSPTQNCLNQILIRSGSSWTYVVLLYFNISVACLERSTSCNKRWFNLFSLGSVNFRLSQSGNAPLSMLLHVLCHVSGRELKVINVSVRSLCFVWIPMQRCDDLIGLYISHYIDTLFIFCYFFYSINTYAKELSQDSNTGKTNAKTKNESALSRWEPFILLIHTPPPPPPHLPLERYNFFF